MQAVGTDADERTGRGAPTAMAPRRNLLIEHARRQQSPNERKPDHMHILGSNQAECLQLFAADITVSNRVFNKRSA
jgi:hypothetical protein